MSATEVSLSASELRTESPASTRDVRRRALYLALAYWLLLLPLTLTPKPSANPWSRYMTIESLVERQTLIADDSPLLEAARPDVVRFGDHFYSDKPPVLSFLAAAVYAPLSLLRWKFTGASVHADRIPNLVLSWVIVGGCSAWVLYTLRRLFALLPLKPLTADVLTLGLGVGSLLLVYGVTLNNHSVAAALILAAFATVLRQTGAGWAAVAGALTGLAAVIDLPAGGLLLVGLGLWIAVRAGRQSVYQPICFIAGALPPLMLHALLQTLISGSPLPAEMSPQAFEYAGSYWANAGRAQENGSRWAFAVEFLAGPQGWLSMTPVLIVGLIEIVRITLRRGDRFRPAALLVGGMLVVLIGYYVFGTRRTDFAGISFGTRHLLAVTPLVYFFAVVWFSRVKRPVIVFAVLFTGSLAYALIGVQQPWLRIELNPIVSRWRPGGPPSFPGQAHADNPLPHNEKPQ